MATRREQASPVIPPDGQARSDADLPISGMSETAKKPGGARRLIAIAVGILVVLLAALLGYRTWYDATHFVWTDNAQVSGSIIQVGALNAGRIMAVLTDVGQTVQEGQDVAQISVPQPIAATANGTLKLGFTQTQNQQVDVMSPLTGIVVARLADPGSTVAPGQSIIAVVDPTQLSVTANVAETDVERIKVGEPVDVTVDSLGMTLPGRVVAVPPASAGSFSLLPQQNSSGNFTKVVQVVPIKIAVDYGNLPLVVGSSVEVNIHVQ